MSNDTAHGTGGPVYMVVSGETRDPARMQAYSRALVASGLYPKLGGYYVNAPKPVDIFEGEINPTFAMLIARFPSLEAARSFWHSEVYQNEIKPLRQNPSAGDYTVAVYEEANLPDYMRGRVDAHDYR